MNFQDIRDSLMGKAPKRLVAAAAEDADVLLAVSEAAGMGLTEPVLVGNKEKIKSEAQRAEIDLSGMEILHADDNLQAVKSAVSLVSSGEADVLMKGLLTTAELLKGVLNKEWGLGTGMTLSHIAVMEAPMIPRILLMTDAGMVMYPDVKTKADLIKNAVGIAGSFGIKTPKVACIAAVEMVNPAMQATLDAAALTLMNQRGQIGGCVVDGPLALDNALSAEAAQHKNIKSPVAGAADILLMPNIEAGNVFFKAASYLGNAKMAGLIAGAKAPIVLTSRADTPEAKLNSIACALAAAR